MFNEAVEQRSQSLDVNLPAGRVLVFDPETGELAHEATPDASGRISLELSIPACRSLVLVVER